MSFEPFNWNVIVVGAWNRAILTPDWIAKFIFKVEEDTSIAVEVPLNVQAPWRVKRDNVAISVGGGNLEVVADVCDYDTLDLARDYGRRALEELPRTPMTAAGFNVRYRSEETPPELACAMECGLDGLVSDAGFDIEGRRVHRSLPYDGGLINLDVLLHPDQGAVCMFNFHRASDDPETLKSWLEIPVGIVREKINSLIDKLPGVTI